MISVSLVGDRELVARLNAMPGKLRQALLVKVTELSLRLENKVKSEKLSGQVLKVKTGALRASIFSDVSSTDNSVTGRVASSGDVKYAAIHEFGGHIPAREIVADKAQALSFLWGGKQAFFKRVHWPGADMPERSFLRSALTDMKDDIAEGFTQAVAEALHE